MVTFQTYEVKGVTWGTPSFILVIGQIFGEDGYSLKASSSVAICSVFPVPQTYLSSALSCSLFIFIPALVISQKGASLVQYADDILVFTKVFKLLSNSWTFSNGPD